MLDTLESYQCERFEIVGEYGQEVQTFSGGGFTDAIAKQGLQPLILLLEQVQEIRAFDRGDQIVFRREGEQVQVRYRWKNGSQYQQLIPLKTAPRNLPEKHKPVEPDFEDFIEEELPEPKHQNFAREGAGDGLRQKDAKIAVLKEKISQLENQLQEAQNANISGELEKNDSSEKDARIALLEQKINLLENQLREASVSKSSRVEEQRLAFEREARIAHLEQKNTELENQLQEASVAMASKEESEKGAEKEAKIIHLEQKIAFLENQLQEVRTTSSSRERAAFEKDSKIALLGQRISHLENQLQEASRHNALKEEENKDDPEREAKIAHLEEKNALLEEQLQEVNTLREAAILEVAELKKRGNDRGAQAEDDTGEGYARLGRRFCQKYGVVAPYVAGAMAGGIASVPLVQAMSRAGMLAFFGSGGLPLEHLQYALQGLSQEQNIWGCNLLHNPNEPMVEETSVDMFLHFGVRVISASAYIRLTKALIRYRYAGINMVNGEIYCPNQVFAKISHPSIAERFLSPPPQNLMLELMREGFFSQEQINWAQRIPVASALIVEGDSGGHTDSRPLSVIFPAIRDLREHMVRNYQFSEEVLLGAAGGLGEPFALKAAYAMGADFVVVGSVHQSTVEAGTSPKVKELLASATIVDCAMGAAPDMFEQGAHVQVFSKNNFYALRSKKLFNMYKQYPGIFEIPRTEIDRLERQIFQAPLQQIWNEVQMYWQERDPRQLERANREPKHQMALMFRWYLGQSSRWAREGNLARVKDFQIWCGPAIGAFNAWAKGSKFERAEGRNIVEVAFALLDGVLKIK